MSTVSSESSSMEDEKSVIVTGFTRPEESVTDIKAKAQQTVQTDTVRDLTSKMVPGIQATKTPVDIRRTARPFTERPLSGNFHSSSNQDSDSSVVTPLPSSRDKPIQEMNSLHNSRPVYRSLGDTEDTPSESVQSRRFYNTSTAADEETPLLPPPSEQVCYKRRICVLSKTHICYIVSGILISLVLLTLSLSLLTHYSVDPGTISNQVVIGNGDLYVARIINTYLYQTIEVVKSFSNQCHGCRVSVYAVASGLYPYADDFSVTMHLQKAAGDGVLLRPLYFLDESAITVSFAFISTTRQNSTVELAFYSELEQFIEFQDGKNPTPYFTYPILVSDNTTFIKKFEIHSTGYRFVAIRPQNHTAVTFNMTLTVDRKYYMEKNFPHEPNCVIELEEKCLINLPRRYTEQYTSELNTTLLVYSEPPKSVANSNIVTLNITVSRGFWSDKSITLVTFSGIVFIVLSCFLCYCCCCIFISYRKYNSHL